jgi:dTDP-4-dehydrorhamnose reductase/dTDP-4-dehydrorhamnose 3,5-epimerase
MNIVKTKLDDVWIIEPDVFGDHRGWFTETYSKKKFEEVGITVNFIQDNHSMSSQKGTLRGLHYQTNPKAQTKLVRCSKGKILDVAVDLRKGSATFGNWVSVELSDENKRQLLIPKGFAHGFLSLTDKVEVQYKVDEFYSVDCDRSIRYNDPDIGVEWGIENPILSQKDLSAPFLRDRDPGFSMRFLVTGGNGQLGHDVVKRLRDLNMDVVAPTRSEFDITNREQVFDYVCREKPDFIIHCAAYTFVDKAEDEKELCYSINVNGTMNVVDAAKIVNARMVFISSDYVFGGTGDEANHEDTETNPVNYYGYTKELGEQLVKNSLLRYFIVRTSWVYGLHGNNFVKSRLLVIRWVRQHILLIWRSLSLI